MDPAEMQGVASTIRVLVSYSPEPRVVDLRELTLPAGSTAADALRVSGLIEAHGLILDGDLQLGIWMKARALDTVLREADRVEVYRPLKVDPKEARRQRYRKQQPTA